MDIVFHIAGVFEPWHILTLLLGVSGGLILGATPGISPTLSVALLIPFTFHMGATTSLILLGAVYAASIAGGAPFLSMCRGRPRISRPPLTVTRCPKRAKAKMRSVPRSQAH
jgi:hypothetical protein